MKHYIIILSFAFFSTLISLCHAESIEEILQSNAPDDEKKELIFKSLQSSFKANGQLPKFATTATLKSYFSFYLVEAGRPPFELEYNENLYCIEFMPKAPANHFKIFFTSERRASSDWLLDLMSSDSERSQEFIMKQVLFLNSGNQ